MKNNTNCEKIIDAILKKITDRELNKGDKLPTERVIAESMGVSRASVREAIKSLSSMGIVESIQGSGSYITAAPEESINTTLCALFSLSKGTLREVIELRILLEGSALEDVVKYATDEEIEKISSLAQYDYLELPASKQAVLDSQFHKAIVNHSNNSINKYLYTTLSILMDRYREDVLTATYKMNENDLTQEGHYEICAALAARNAAAAKAALSEHLRLNEHYLETLEK